MSVSMKKSLENRQNRNTTAAEKFKAMNLKPIPEKNMPKWAKAASQAHRRATKKKRADDDPRQITQCGHIFLRENIIEDMTRRATTRISSLQIHDVGTADEKRHMTTSAPSTSSPKSPKWNRLGLLGARYRSPSVSETDGRTGR